jgi:nucleoporin SEH1
VYSQSCGHLSIYTSLDFVTVRQDTFLALTTRDGMLSFHEPVVPTKYSDWREVDQFWIDDHQYGRGIATSFKVAFNQAQRPNWKAVAAGVDKNAFTVAIAAMNVVKIYRVQNSKPDRSGPYQFQAPVAELTGARGNVRDMTWASGSSRDYDILVTASADGYVRVYHIYVNPADEPLPIDQASTLRPIQRANTHAPQVWTSTAPSGIGAGLAGNTRNQTSSQSKDGQVPHEWKIVAELKQEGVWKVEWNYGGMILSTGDDGRVLLWSKGLDGKWQEFANIEPEDHDQRL